MENLEGENGLKHLTCVSSRILRFRRVLLRLND